MNKVQAILAVIAMVVNGGAYAQNIDGLYQPSAANWSCSPDQVGSDGGALAIQNGILEGVENRCDLTNPQSSGRGTEFTAVCSAEGTSYEQQMTITPTANGVSIQRDGFTSYWKRCESAPASANTASPPLGSWGYDNGTAFIVAANNSFELSCEPYSASSTYPTARLSAPCLTCFPMETSIYTLRVDGQFNQDYEFKRVSNAEGSISGLDYYPLWNEGLVTALMAGSVLEIIEQDNVIATFPLAGSSRAISQLRQRCN